MFVIPTCVTELLRQYKAKLSLPFHTSNIEAVCSSKDYLGMYVSSSKETCAEFVQALLWLNSGGSSDCIGGASTSGGGDSSDGSSVVSKKLSGVAMVEDTMVLFVNCPARTVANKGARASNAGSDGTDGCSEVYSVENDVFTSDGRYVNWSVEAPLLVRENSARANKMRSLLLQDLTNSASVDYNDSCEEGNGGSSSGSADVRNKVLLFVRQNAAPYVYCGEVSVSSIQAQAFAPTADQLDSTTTNTTGSTNSAGVSALNVTFELREYDAVYNGPSSGTVDGMPLYRDMMQKFSGAM